MIDEQHAEHKPDKVQVVCNFGDGIVSVSLNYDNITAAEIAAVIRAAYDGLKRGELEPDVGCVTFINSSAIPDTNPRKPWWGE